MLAVDLILNASLFQNYFHAINFSIRIGKRICVNSEMPKILNGLSKAIESKSTKDDNPE